MKSSTCVQCRRDAGFNRAIVDVETGAELGGLCHDCEQKTFGICLEEHLRDASEQCLFCSVTGSVGLPTHKLEINLVDGEEGVEENYALTDETARLCPNHANRLFDIEFGTVEEWDRTSTRRRPPNV